MIFFKYNFIYFDINVNTKHFIQYMMMHFLIIDDHSRVTLKTSSSNEGDYINANYIEVRTSNMKNQLC